MMDLKVCVIFLMLGIATQIAENEGCEDGEDTFDKLRNVRPKGFSCVLYKKGTSLKKCQNRCLSEDECEAFDYRKTASKKKKCCLYYDPQVLSAQQFKMAKKEDHYMRQRCSELTTLPPTTMGPTTMPPTTMPPTTMPPTTLPPTTMPPTTMPPTTMPPTTLPPTTVPPTTIPPTTIPPTTLPPTTMPPTTEAPCGYYFEELSGEFSSPDFPDEYPGNVYCVWEIALYGDMKVHLWFESFQLEEHFDYLTIYDGGEEVARYTGYDVPSSLISSSSNVTVVMTTDAETSYQGFSASYECADSFELYKTNSRPKKSRGIRYKVANNLYDCELACLSKNNCVGFNYRRNKGKGQRCYVYTKTTNAFKKAKKEDYYQRVRACRD